MCVIAVKPKGVELLSNETLQNCFDNNPDGAGFMYNPIGADTVVIEKGLMKLEDLKNKINSHNLSSENVIVYHFRISTHGGVCPENTHPFPLSQDIESLKAIKIITDIGIAHNGILSTIPEDKTISDTQEFIKTVLATENIRNGLFTQDKAIHKAVMELAKGSRLCVMVGNKLSLLGTGWIRLDSGLFFSNSSYEKREAYNFTLNTGKWKYDHRTKDWYKLNDKGEYELWSFVDDKKIEDKDKELKDINDLESGLLERELMLKEILNRFLEAFFDRWQGNDTKHNWEWAFKKAYKKVRRELIAVDPEEFEDVMDYIIDSEYYVDEDEEEAKKPAGFIDTEEVKDDQLCAIETSKKMRCIICGEDKQLIRQYGLWKCYKHAFYRLCEECKRPIDDGEKYLVEFGKNKVLKYYCEECK